MQVSLYRYDPDKDVKPHMQHTTVDVPEGSDLMVLDVLEMLKAEDPSLSFRRSCREGVCGSDGINMNGRNGLACITPLSEAAPRGKLELRPLPGLPVIRDLVVDLTQFYEQYEKVKPWLSGRTLVLVTHRASLLALVDRIIVMDKGRVVADGPKDEVLSKLAAGRIGAAAA